MEFRSTVAIASRDSGAETEALFGAFQETHPETGPVMGFSAELPTVGSALDTVAASGVVDVTFAFEASTWHDAFARALELFGEAFEASALSVDLPIVSVLLEAADLSP
jgi:hypothetical protein